MNGTRLETWENHGCPSSGRPNRRRRGNIRKAVAVARQVFRLYVPPRGPVYSLPPYSQNGTLPSFCARYGGLNEYLYSNFRCGASPLHDDTPHDMRKTRSHLTSAAIFISTDHDLWTDWRTIGRPWPWQPVGTPRSWPQTRVASAPSAISHWWVACDSSPAIGPRPVTCRLRG